jgi:hypothetical protein
MPHKIGMLLTYTNRKSFPPLQKPVAQQQKQAQQQNKVAQQQKQAQQQNKVAQQQNPPAPMKTVNHTHSMRTIIRTPGKSCSSCGH